MPLFSRFKNRGAQPAAKTAAADDANGSLLAPAKPKWQAQWTSKEVVPDEVAELVHACTAEMKSRAEALDAPFLLLPFRPDSDPHASRSFIRNFYKSNAEGSAQYRGAALQQELRLTEAIVLCSILKWCWSRMPNGVVTWPVYEGFQLGEKESHMARNAFHTFIPISADSPSRTSIIFDFFDLMSAVAAHGKMNGLGGRKLSRLAGWWAFEHTDDGKGFDGGYKSWQAAADASSHLFFAYLRSLSPDTHPSLTVIERIPRSLQALLASTEYPPEVPALLQRTTPRVLMLVDSVSPTPFALLRRARHFEYRDNDRVLREYQEFEDPLDSLTDECKRVLYAISTTNSTTTRSRQGAADSKPDAAWSAFSNMGFSDIDERALDNKSPTGLNGSGKTLGSGLRSEARSRDVHGNRPTTPSWADFLSSGFTDDDTNKSPALLYPPAQVLPPLGSRVQTPSTMTLPGEDEDLAPGELAAITNVELDDAFWWVWMTSLSGEEPSSRKAVFGRCALIETSIMNGHWLVMEEQVKGASPDPAEGAYIAPKKKFFTFTKRGRKDRKKVTSKLPPTQEQPARALTATPSKTSLGTDQHAKIKAAAAALTRTQDTPDNDAASRRGRRDEPQSSTKTNSVLTVGLQSEAGPAMQWTSAYDKNTIRAHYLGDQFAGKGVPPEMARKASATTLYTERDSVVPADSASLRAASVVATDSGRPDGPAAAAESVVTQPAESAVSETTAVADPAGQTSFAQPASVPGSTLPDSLEKELAVEEPQSPRSDVVGRKPVPRADNHPAYRQPAAAPPVTPTQNAAALAAQRAMQSSQNTSPESVKSQNKLRKQVGGNGGLKKLFGKKKEAPASGRNDSLDMPRPAGSSLAPSSDSSITRRISLMRKKPEAPSPKQEQSPYSPPVQAAVAEPLAQAPSALEAPAHNLSRSDVSEHEAAAREFSRFDQGPLQDMPADAPSFDESLSPPANEPEFHTATAKRLVAQDTPDFGHDAFVQPSRSRSPAAPAVADDNASETTMEDSRDPGVVQDRWATIRENAARRAARQSEEQSSPSRPSQSQRTDDGETSGEETIESRVARIKARVAELTGNIDVHR